MRRDMPKLLVERPRWGHAGRNATVKKDRHLGRLRDVEALDALPSTGPKRPRDGSRKMFGENLAPLRRFLLGNVGRPWDKVHAEIAEHLSPSSAVQQHVFQHLYAYVHRHVVIEGRRVFARERWGRGRTELFRDPWTLYVHPATGLLCVPKRVRPREARRSWEPEVPRHVRGGDAILVELEGQWYRVDVKPVPHGERVTDVVFGLQPGGELSARARALYGQGGVYGAGKRQLSRKELVLAGLRQ